MSLFTESACSGCRDNLGNQLAHYGPTGCLGELDCSRCGEIIDGPRVGDLCAACWQENCGDDSQDYPEEEYDEEDNCQEEEDDDFAVCKCGKEIEIIEQFCIECIQINEKKLK